MPVSRMAASLSIIGCSPRARGHYAHTVMQRHLLIGGVQIRIVTASLTHSRLGVVGNRQAGSAAIVFQSPHVRSQPSLHLLVAGRFGVGVRAISECARQRSPGESSVMAFETSLSATWYRTTIQAGMIL